MISQFFFQFGNLILAFLSLLIVFFFGGCGLFLFNPLDLSFNLLGILDWVLGCQVRGRHVDQVNSLVRQTALWNILNRVVDSSF